MLTSVFYSGFQAEAFAGWLSARSGVQLKVQRPFDVVAVSLNILAVLSVLVVGHYMYNRAGKVIRSKYLWASMSLVCVSGLERHDTHSIYAAHVHFSSQALKGTEVKQSTIQKKSGILWKE